MGGSLEDSAGKSGLGLHWKILIGMAFGALTGIACNLFVQGQGPDAVAKLKWFTDTFTFPIGNIFLRLIFMVVVPLVFCALTLGVAEIGDVRKLGRLGIRTLVMTLIFSTASVLI
jgi:DAACS family dicarboxylate/amino acid:cation (Na+ or H+) symporter